jgi:hypothetical protein
MFYLNRFLTLNSLLAKNSQIFEIKDIHFSVIYDFFAVWLPFAS